MDSLYFATGNKGKLNEMKPHFEERDIELIQVEADVPEIDAMDVEKVARQKVLGSYEEADVDGPIIVEDTGFFVETIGGFPGAEAAFFATTAGAEKLLDMMRDEEERSAYFKTAIALYYPEEDRVETFTGKMKGRVPEEKRGESHPHLPYNSYFIPEGESESLAENEGLKDERMHRRKAMRKLLDYLN